MPKTASSKSPKRLADALPVEIALADTIGVANPAHVARLVERVREAISPLPVRVHFHNTRNTGLANVWAAVMAGASVVDASLGGLGWLPVRAGRGGQCAKRGRGLHARTRWDRHRHGFGKTDRRQQLAVGRYGTKTAGNGGAIAALPERQLEEKIMGYRLGVDVGGTFTDLLLFNADTGAFWRHKTPSTPHDSSEGILNGVTAICADAGVDQRDIEYFLHGTTVATNAVLEGKGARVGLIVTEGYRDIMQIARSFVPGGLAGWIIWPKPTPLAALEDTVTSAAG